MSYLHQLLAAVQADPDAQCVTLFRNGSAKVLHRWGTYIFETPEALEAWVKTKQLSQGDSTKFKD